MLRVKTEKNIFGHENETTISFSTKEKETNHKWNEFFYKKFVDIL